VVLQLVVKHVLSLVGLDPGKNLNSQLYRRFILWIW
jgi:hypothetical protein